MTHWVLPTPLICVHVSLTDARRDSGKDVRNETSDAGRDVSTGSNSFFKLKRL